MTNLSADEEKMKRAIFESMSPRMRDRIMKRGYDTWDPFAPPKDPADLRLDKAKHTAAMLVRKFLSTQSRDKYGKAYSQGAWEICVGLINESDRYRGMYEFSNWYQDFLLKPERDDLEGKG